MKLKVLFILLLVLGPLTVSAQHKRMKKKDSKAQGTFFGYWGYNQSAYTKSNIRFVGPDYDFTLNGAVAKDRPTGFSLSNYITNFTIPQFNARIGYYFKDNWAISFGYDHMKYVYSHDHDVYLSGTIGPNANPPAGWSSGTFNAEPLSTDKKYFHYENSDGLNYLRFELTRTNHLAELGSNDQFVISSNIGVGAGGLLSFNDFTFGGVENVRTVSLSGYGLSMHANLRFEFFRHVFLQTGISGGFHHQVKVKTRPYDSSSFARHTYGYSEWSTVLGFFLYIRSKNGCGGCPEW